MHLPVRSSPKIIPDYSLTGDLLSYLKCGLQYRYQNGSALPPARPVQLWFGEFIHGVLEMAYALWKTGNYPDLPWPNSKVAWPDRNDPSGHPDYDLGEIGRKQEVVLQAQGKLARSSDAREMAYARAEQAVNILGPHLFPLVDAAEQPLVGSRMLPPVPGGPQLRATRYGLTGVVDVLTSITLTDVPPTNLIRKAVEEAVAASGITLPPEFEVIVDYKGARRPRSGAGLANEWQQHEWQVQTYAWLRQTRAEALPVAAGVLIYISELWPGVADIQKLQVEMKAATTDVLPAKGSPDEHFLRAWTSGVAIANQLSLPFRMARALRVIPVTAASISTALNAFDHVVADIEGRIATEVIGGHIPGAWQPTCADAQTCSACDFRYFCPKPVGLKVGAPPDAP